MTPLELVQEQLAAYNERNLERFSACFFEDVRCYRLPEMTLILDGKPAFAAFYARERFSRSGLRAEIVDRIVMGNTIIDHELIHGLADEAVEMAVMFVIEHGLIATVFSIPTK